MASKKRKKKVSNLLPITRSVRRLKELGWNADIAERKTGPFSKDWGGFADIIAIRQSQECGLEGGAIVFPEVLFVQATGWGNVRDREKKIYASQEALNCIMCGARIEVWGWHKEKVDPKIIVIDDYARFDPTPV